MIELKSGVLEITKVKRKTKATMIKNLKVGDRIQMMVGATPSGTGNRGTFAKYVTIKNLENGEFTHKSFNQLSQLFSVVEMSYVNEKNETFNPTEKYNNALFAFNADVQIQLANPIVFKVDKESFLKDAKLLDELDFKLRTGVAVIVEKEG